MFLFFLSFFWFLRSAKIVLFWIYFWQLKEYHIGRFLDHFRTHKGKKLIYDPFQLLKIVLAGFSVFSKNILIILPFILFLLYFAESVFVIRSFLGRRLKKPALTQKTIVLISSCLLILVLWPLFLYSILRENIFWFSFWLLIFDIAVPIIISAVVLIIQPFVVFFWRNKILEKAKKKRESFKNLLIIGITGSYGKTSTKEFLADILEQKFPGKVLKTKEHQNSEIGIARCILNELKPEHEIFVVEMAAYNKGGIKLLCDIVRPKIGVVTGVNEQHLATFGSMENLLSAEGGEELINSLPEDGTAFFNAKNKYCAELYKKTKIKKYLYAKNAKSFGEENLLGASSVAKELGMTNREISLAIKKIENKLPGIQQRRGVNNLTIFDASYSNNPTGVIAHLEYFKSLRQYQSKLIIVMPCLIELGEKSKEVHLKIGEKIGEICDLAIITTKDRFKEIKEGALKKGIKEEGILFIENPGKIFEIIKNFSKKADIVLLEGRVPSQLVKKLTVNNKNESV